MRIFSLVVLNAPENDGVHRKERHCVEVLHRTRELLQASFEQPLVPVLSRQETSPRPLHKHARRVVSSQPRHVDLLVRDLHECVRAPKKIKTDRKGVSG